MSLIRSEGSGDVDLGFYNGVTSRSAMFNDGDSDYLHITPASSGDRRKWTYSTWVKSCIPDTGAGNKLLAYSAIGDERDSLGLSASQKIQYQLRIGGTGKCLIESNAQLRDFSAWYNIIMVFDSDNGTEADRVIFYVNGSRLDVTASTAMVQNTDSYINHTVSNQIGFGDSGGGGYFDGYMADINFIDGQALAATSFGETKNGVWIPIDTSGLTFGTNGFRLEFKQTGTGTASTSTVGADTSGNTNHFTSSGHPKGDIVDNPENNFCTLNSLQNQTSATLAEGNLDATGAGASGWDNLFSTFAVSSGKWYWEARCDSLSELEGWVAGIHQTGFPAQALHWYSPYYTASPDGVNFGVQDGNKKVTNTAQSSFTSDIAVGDVVQLRLNLDDNELSISVDGSDKGKMYDITANLEYSPALSLYKTSSATMNFGQNGTFDGQETAGGNADENGHGNFFSAVESGYLALCSANLDEPTISPNSATQADDHFEATLYTSDNIGSGGTQNVTNVNFQPDLVWLKNRDSGSTSHTLFDSSRSTGGNNYHIATDNNAAPVGANSQYGYLSAFNSNGFTLTGGSTNANYVNQSTDKYVAYNWKANGGTTSSNTEGDKTATLQANTTAGFSIVKYAGSSLAETVGHGLDSAPEMVIVKSLTDAERWCVFHAGDNDAYLYLNETFAAETSNADERFGNSTSVVVPSSTLVTLGADNSDVNENGDDYIMYCFHSVSGYSKMGAYEGNGSTDGTFIYTGFRPAWVMTKRTDSTGNWYINDTARSPLNPTDSYGDNLYADLANDESGNGMDILSNGFKIRNTDGSQNASGGNYIYLAFAEMPFKYALGR